MFLIPQPCLSEYFLLIIKNFFIRIGDPNMTKPISHWNSNKFLNIKLIKITNILEIFDSYKYRISNIDDNTIFFKILRVI